MSKQTEYPFTTRGLAPPFAALFSYVVLQQSLMVGQLVGILIVSTGGYLDLRWSTPACFQRPFAAGALGTSCMVARYSVVDAYGARAEIGWASFTAWLIVLDSLTFLGTVRLIRAPLPWSQFRGGRISAGSLGVCSFVVLVWALMQRIVRNPDRRLPVEGAYHPLENCRRGIDLRCADPGRNLALSRDPLSKS